MAIGGWLLWSRRSSASSHLVAGLVVAVTAGWAWALLDRTPQWQPWLRTLIVIAGGACLVGLAAGALRGPLRRGWRRRSWHSQ